MEEGLASNILEAVDQPLDLAMNILEMRSFASAKRAIDDAHQENAKMPDHPMIDTVFEVVKDIADKRRSERTKGAS